MVRRIRIAFAVAFLLILSLAACGGGQSGGVQSGPNMKEGLWEITIKMDMPGMPMQMPPQSFRYCLTQKDMIPTTPEQPGQTGPDKCTEVKHEVKGDTVTWALECKTEDGVMTSAGTLTYKNDLLDGLVKIRVPDGNKGTIEMTQHLTGRWVGPCK